MFLEPVDRNAHYRERRRRARRRRRLRRLVAGGVLVLLATGAAFVARGTVGDGDRGEQAAATKPAKAPSQQPPRVGPRPAPLQMRGVHVTMALASIPGKLEEYLNLPGLNTLELDVKDENGEVGFIPSTVPLAREIGAAKPYYKPRVVMRRAWAHGVYLVGRIVCFEDPVLAEQRPDLAIHRRDGSVWRNHAGLGWTNPYNREVWDYLVDLGEAAAKNGFDEIQFDYVRFPSDGDVDAVVYPGKTSTPPGWVIAGFLHYASKRLKPLGVRVSADVFGLSATRDLGIGQVPRRISRYLDAIYPMVYPSHYASGEYNLPDPNAAPGETVAHSLSDFNRELGGRRTVIIPWLQDFSYGRTYTLDDLKAQINAAAAARTGGFLLWNAAGIYTADALLYEPTVG
ncbi:MAG: putative glycoside hydrolase [Gaiellaceae bacterium]